MDFDMAHDILMPRQYSGGRQRSRGRRLATGAIVGIVIACVVVLVLGLLCCYFCCCRKKRSKKNSVVHGHASQPAPAAGGGGFLSKLGAKIPGNNPPGAYNNGPGMQEAGYANGGYPPQGQYGAPPPPQGQYGAPPQQAGYGYGPQQPAPAYR